MIISPNVSVCFLYPKPSVNCLYLFHLEYEFSTKKMKILQDTLCYCTLCSTL